MAPSLMRHPYPPALDQGLRPPSPPEEDGGLALLLSRQPSPPMILEAFSTWIAHQIPHRILAYWNTRQRHLHLVLPDPNSHRDAFIQAAQDVFRNPLPRTRFWRKNEMIHHLWQGYPLDRFDHLLLIQSRQTLSIEKANLLLRQALPALNQALRPRDPEENHAMAATTSISSS